MPYTRNCTLIYITNPFFFPDFLNYTRFRALKERMTAKYPVGFNMEGGHHFYFHASYPYGIYLPNCGILQKKFLRELHVYETQVPDPRR